MTSVIPLGTPKGVLTPVVEKSRPELKIRQQWRDFLMQREYRWFVTLTYGRDVHRATADKDLAMFHKRLYSKLYRDKVGQPLSFAAVLEGTSVGNAHWHLLFEPIAKRHGESSAEEEKRFADLVTKVWSRMGNTPFSTVGIRVDAVHQQAGVVDYLLKEFRIHQNFDFIELAHLSRGIAL
jgi:hypothetical protein